MKLPWRRSNDEPLVEAEPVKQEEEEVPPPAIQQRFDEIARYEEAVKLTQARLRYLKEGRS